MIVGRPCKCSEGVQVFNEFGGYLQECSQCSSSIRLQVFGQFGHSVWRELQVTRCLLRILRWSSHHHRGEQLELVHKKDYDDKYHLELLDYHVDDLHVDDNT